MSSEAITIPFNFDPRTYQQSVFEAFDSGKYDRYLLRWSRRAGKDKTCLNLLVREMLTRIGMYFYIFPSYAQARKAIWEGADMDGFRFMDHIPQSIRRKTNNNEMKIELINGSIFRIIGSDNYDSIMGTNPLGCIFSEYSLQDPNAWDYIRPILAQNKGWALFNGTPRGQNHMYMLEKDAIGAPNWFISEVQSLWPDLPNYYPVVSLEDIEKDRRVGMDEGVIESEYGVSYVAGKKGSFFGDQIVKARETGRIGNFPPNDHKWVETFWDLGASDDMVVWFRQREEQAKIWIDYWEGSGVSLSEVVQILKEKGYKYKAHYLPHDADQKRQGAIITTQASILQDLLRQAGMSDDIIVAKRPQDKQLSIDLTRKQFSNYFFNEGLCSDGITKVSLYHRKWDKVRKVFMEQPVHDWCVTGDTKVRTLSGWKQIEDIKTGEYVWGYSEKERRLVPALITFSGRTRKKAQLLEVALDNGKSIKCTPDHRFMLRSGKYIEARYLTKGDSLMPFYEHRSSKYLRIELNDGSFGYEHALVYSRFKSYVGGELHIDHIDGNKNNNDPSNLVGLTHQDHCSKTFKGLTNKERCNIDKTNYTVECYSRKFIYKDCDFCKAEFIGDHKTAYCSSDCLRLKNKERHSRTERKKRGLLVNHKVRFVRELDYCQDVYDLTVPETGNFVAEGVIIHNCSHAADALMTEALTVDLQSDFFTPAVVKIKTAFDPWEL